VVVGGRRTSTLRPRDLADAVGFVHQDPEAQFVVDHVEHDIAFGLENLGADAATMRRRVEEVLDALGVAHLRHRSPATLSGGERQRCAIAGALATAPPVLVLDEPTAMLDPQGGEDVLAAVARLNADLGTTVVLAEHNLDRAAPMADTAVRLDGGRVAASGPPADVVAGFDGAPPVTHLGRLLGWEPPPLTVREARAWARRHRHELEAMAGEDRTPLPPAAGETLLRADGLFLVHGSNVVLGPLDLELAAGEVVAVLGRNGSGKTTLLRSLAGLHAPTRGAVSTTVPVGHVPQDPGALLFAPTVRAELAETTRLTGLAGDRDARVQAWLDRMGVTSLADHHPRSLSAGQRQRVAIAAVGIGGAPVLLLDEPTRGIDAASRAALEAMVAAHAGDGGAVMLATHDVELAARAATRVVVLGDGDVVADGAARDVLSGSLFAPQVLRVLPPYLTVAEVAAASVVSRP
jgi:energy-coupling factor transport system ATP-binding protein